MFTTGILYASYRHLFYPHQSAFVLARPDTVAFKAGLYMHVFTAAIALIFGTAAIYKPSHSWHRKAGYAYVFLVLVFAAPGGFILSFYSFDSLVSFIPLALLALAWFYCTYLGLRYARMGRLEKHQIWMTRSYALACSAIVLRILLGLKNTFPVLEFPFAYSVCVWLSILIPLGISELSTRRRNQNFGT